ncbi:MAG: hypothetical protein AB1765_04270 [Candidatus Hydrogenedentota bacterium]
MSAVFALHYWVLGLLGYCVFALYTKDEKPDVCLSCLLLLLDIIIVTMFFEGDVFYEFYRGTD